MFICTQCQANVSEEDSHLFPISSEEEKESFKQDMNSFGMDDVELSEPKRYHYREEIAGRRRTGVIGGWRINKINCGPLEIL